MHIVLLWVTLLSYISLQWTQCVRESHTHKGTIQNVQMWHSNAKTPKFATALLTAFVLLLLFLFVKCLPLLELYLCAYCNYVQYWLMALEILRTIFNKSNCCKYEQPPSKNDAHNCLSLLSSLSISIYLSPSSLHQLHLESFISVTKFG